MKDIFVYGTLRVGNGNFGSFQRRFGEENMQILRTNVPLKEYKMAGMGIPFTFYTGDENDVVYGDILRVSDECCEAIDRMELGAGYYIDTVHPEPEGSYRAYLYKKEDLPYRVKVIKNGDFNKPVS